jgi:hypothetical protein
MLPVLVASFVLAFCPFAAESGEVRLGIAGILVEDVRELGRQIDADSLFIKNLQEMENVVVLERKELMSKIGSEVRFQESGLVDEQTAIQIGKIAGVNYMLLGTVTPTNKMSSKRDQRVYTSKGRKGSTTRTVINEVDESHEISVTITARIVDVETSQVVWSGSETSDAKENKTYDASSYYVGISNELTSGIAANLANESAYFLSYKLRREFAGEYIYVTDRSGKDFIIDSGTAHGVENGMVFLVYAEGREIKGKNNKVLGVEPIIIAALKVKNVQGLYSVCSVAKPSVGETIVIGDRVEPIRFKRSSKLAYPKKRPENIAKRESKSSQLLAELMDSENQ